MAVTETGTTQRATVAIRAFRPEDSPAIVEISNLLLPDHPRSVEETRFEDEQFTRGNFFLRRFVAVDSSGEIVGSLSFNQMPWAFHPDRYAVWGGVRPGSQRKGVGESLYTVLMDELEDRKAVAARTWVRESTGETTAWLARRGFRELHRSWGSRLDVAAFDATRFSEHARVPAGIEVVTLEDEMAVDPGRIRAVYEMDNELSADVPRVDPYTSPPFEMFRDFALSGPQAVPAACFLAKDGDRYVGVSSLERVESQDTLHVGFTGVRRECRGRGIAMHLKLRAIGYAKRHGYRWITTGNSSLNAPMLGINTKLGFAKETVWLVMGKDLGGA